jgi:DNA-binding transcriptional ArsR family regulator
MADVFEELASLDRLIHEPARLSIMTALSVVQSADFTSLQRITGLSAGNLSNHLAKLEEGRLVQSPSRANRRLMRTGGGSRNYMKVRRTGTKET